LCYGPRYAFRDVPEIIYRTGVEAIWLVDALKMQTYLMVINEGFVIH
jgi:hypothetical protein